MWTKHEMALLRSMFHEDLKALWKKKKKNNNNCQFKITHQSSICTRYHQRDFAFATEGLKIDIILQRRYSDLGKSRALYVNNLLFSFLGSKETNSETPMIPKQDNYQHHEQLPSL